MTGSAAGVEVAAHDYYPFDGEVSDASQNEIEMKFTGHERDANGSGAGALDYMHARYCSPSLARFLAIDPAKSARIKVPQSWNRYSYAMGNPIKLVDPDGREVVLASDKKSQKLRRPLIQALRRPSFRQRFIEVATSTDFRVDISAGKVSKPSELMKVRTGKPGELRFAEGLPQKTNGALTGVSLEIDVSAVAVHPSDRTGVWTMAHEFDHLKSAFDAAKPGVAHNVAWQKALDGDQPSSETGPSNFVGEATFQEKPDLTAEEAEKALVRYLSP